MLRSIKSFEGYRVLATDGDVGSVIDLFFDDIEMAARYLVVDTGKWIPGRKVLISPVALQREQTIPAAFSIPVAKKVIENSPPIEADQPVSYEYEAELAKHYGWPVYWEGFKIAAASAIGQRSEALPEDVKGYGLERKDRNNLRSANEVIGYDIQATDGEIGHVEDFILDDETWMIRYLVIDTRNWLPGRKVLVAPQWTRRISWSEAKVEVDLPRETIKASPEFDPNAPINRQYEMRLYDYYGRPKYWV